VELEVVPVVGEQNVDLAIDMSVDNVTGFADGYKSGYLYRDMPVVNSREFSDRINVPLGKEVVISGMTRERVVNHTKKVPILGSLPVLGWFFGGESARTDKTMVVAVIKPVSVKQMDNFMEDDNTLVSKATGESPITPPDAKAGFDQWLLDSEN
jgi:general secretion pathway protein D